MIKLFLRYNSDVAYFSGKTTQSIYSLTMNINFLDGYTINMLTKLLYIYMYIS